MGRNVKSDYMKTKIIIIAIFICLVFTLGCTEKPMNGVELDNVIVTYLGHASFRIQGTKLIYIDPFVLPENAVVGNYILVTHDHYDHCAVDNINSIQDREKETRIIGTMGCITRFDGLTNSIDPGEFFDYADGVHIEAVEAYNINKSYHPEGFGIGFVVTIDGKKIYHAGDTDKIPEMDLLKNQSIDIALLPIGGTFTMDAEEAAEVAKVINPKYVIPMHYNSERYGIKNTEADPEKLKELLKDTDIQVIILEPLV